MIFENLSAFSKLDATFCTTLKSKICQFGPDLLELFKELRMLAFRNFFECVLAASAFIFIFLPHLYNAILTVQLLAGPPIEDF